MMWDWVARGNKLVTFPRQNRIRPSGWDIPCSPTLVLPTPISPTSDEKVVFHLLIKSIEHQRVKLTTSS